MTVVPKPPKAWHIAPSPAHDETDFEDFDSDETIRPGHESPSPTPSAAPTSPTGTISANESTLDLPFPILDLAKMSISTLASRGDLDKTKRSCDRVLLRNSYAPLSEDEGDDKSGITLQDFDEDEADHDPADFRAAKLPACAEPRAVPDSSSVLDSLETGRLLEGSIGSFDEYIRPNLGTSFIFTFTPKAKDRRGGTEKNVKKDDALLALLEKASERPDYLRHRRMCIEPQTFVGGLGKSVKAHIRSDNWRRPLRESTDDDSRRSGPYHTVSESNARSEDTTATRIRQRFDNAVTRLQDSLSGTSTSRSRGSSEDSQHASDERGPEFGSGSLRFSRPTDKPILPGRPLLENHRGYANAPSPGREPVVPHPAFTPWPQHPRYPASDGTRGAPLRAYLMQPPSSYTTMGRGSGSESSSHSTSAYPTVHHGPSYPRSSHVPQPGVWPVSRNVPGQTNSSFQIAPWLLPQGQPHPQIQAMPHSQPDTVKARPKSAYPRANKIPDYIPLSASEQQKVEEHIELMKATIPNFAMVSKRRQMKRAERERIRKEMREAKAKTSRAVPPPTPRAVPPPTPLFGPMALRPYFVPAGQGQLYGSMGSVRRTYMPAGYSPYHAGLPGMRGMQNMHSAPTLPWTLFHC